MDWHVTRHRDLAKEGAGRADLGNRHIREGADVVLNCGEIIGQIWIAHRQNCGFLAGAVENSLKQNAGRIRQRRGMLSTAPQLSRPGSPARLA